MSLLRYMLGGLGIPGAKLVKEVEFCTAIVAGSAMNKYGKVVTAFLLLGEKGDLIPNPRGMDFWVSVRNMKEHLRTIGKKYGIG